MTPGARNKRKGGPVFKVLTLATILMAVASCMSFIQQAGTLNVNVNYNVKMPEEKGDSAADHQDTAEKWSASLKELEDLKGKMERLEKEKKEQYAASQGEIESLKAKIGTLGKEKDKVIVEGEDDKTRSLQKELHDLKSQLEASEKTKTELALKAKQERETLKGRVATLETEKKTARRGGKTLEGWETERIPLPELSRANERIECPEGLYHVDIISNLTADKGGGRKIPKIIHQTGEQKCMTKAFYDNAVAWSFEGYSYYFHDAEARLRLLQKYWPMFPQLQNSFDCLKSAGGAAIADIWRYMAIWEYGGVYVDMDDAPNKLFNSTTLTPDIDAFFLVSGTRTLSQYFFALSPKHPVMYLAVQDVMEQMHLLDDTGNFYVPRKTGPTVIMRAFLKFMGTKEGDVKNPNFWEYKYPKNGTHYGVLNGNRSVTVVGQATDPNKWVTFHALKRQRKQEGWEKMNYTNYELMNKVPSNKTCLQLILEKHQPQPDAMEELQPRRW